MAIYEIFNDSQMQPRVIQMPNFLKIQSATGFSCDIYHKECENAKKFEKKIDSRGWISAPEVLLYNASTGV